MNLEIFGTLVIDKETEVYNTQDREEDGIRTVLSQEGQEKRKH